MYTAKEYLQGKLKLFLGEIIFTLIAKLIAVPLISVIVLYRFHEHQCSIHKSLPTDV